ncbi:MAG: PQQ-dependent sugar dehydrogenase [Tunicatimonas sp.]|uniref:PQQ-dependent sugar dehydrogenase n=1 Tax=Tunicatimonas sp. TaxID=1940096 RepID=UPI003C71A893
MNIGTNKGQLFRGLAILTFTLLMSYAYGQKGQVVTDAGAIKVNKIVDSLNHPWGIAQLPDERLLITERSGHLRILNNDSTLSEPVEGVPEVFNTGQGGLLDVALDPNFDTNQMVYLSFAEPGEDSTASTALGRGKMVDNRIEDFKVIFRQKDKVSGAKHFGGRIAFTPQGQIFLSLGERFKFDPAQDLTNHLGTVVRLNLDGSVPEDNPFIGQKDALEEIWSYGHRNIISAAIDPATDKLWVAEMGPMGGDEFNQPAAGKNYGWPVVSWGSDYDGASIPEPTTRPEFADAAIHWTPTISPSGMIFYTGETYPEWQGTALIGGLTASGIVRVQINGDQAEEVERIPLTVRARDIEQAADGTIYVITDEKNGKLLHLTPLQPEGEARK